MIIPGWVKPAALGLSLLAAAYGGYHYRAVVADRDEAMMREQAQQVIIQTQKIVQAYEQGLQGMANKLEEQSYENQAKRDAELTYYRNLVNQSGGLYDNGNQASDSTPTGSTSSNQTSTSWTRLSEEAAGFLLEQANKADRVVDQYLQCQQYVMSLTDKAISEANK